MQAGDALAALGAETDRILACFAAAGAVRVEPPSLLPAATLLDLYGEDIRARAYVTNDGQAEMMLRPDFTLPVVEEHMESGAEPARYAYCGTVWRRQEGGKPTEYLQAGFELFDGADPAASDAEVFALIRAALDDAPVEVATGDMGLVLAAIDGLGTTPARRAALRRHVWRPNRFHRLLSRFSTTRDDKANLLAAARAGEAADLIKAAGPHVGLRSADEILGRIARLVEEDDTVPLSRAETDLIETIFGLKDTCPGALAQLQDMRADAPFLTAAVDQFEARLAALSARGIDPETLPFEGSFGRTTLEYYDGFVFGFIAGGRPDLPVIASGGRYDALTRALGRGCEIPAAGGIIRPQALLALRGASC